MCFHSQLSSSKTTLEKTLKAKFKKNKNYIPGLFNGFSHPLSPVILPKNEIDCFEWGLIPYWAKDKQIQKHTLNARIETLKEKPSFSSVISNRCLIPINGFFEWQWKDSKGKFKQKYYIHKADELFCLAGLYSQWIEPNTQSIINSYTIITKAANPLMAEIHNTKKRMPLILNQSEEREWLEQSPIENFNAVINNDLIAEPIYENGNQFSLF